MMRVLQIVPRLWPEIDGVGDFALQLGEEFAARFQIESRFLVAQGIDSGRTNVRILSQQTADSLHAEISELQSDLILLHYSGYGFHKRGVPEWLVNGLENPGVRSMRLVVFFHEIWASGPPWKSEFYLQAGQKRIVRRLMQIADSSLTSTPLMQQLLLKCDKTRTPSAPVLVPIPSAVSPIERLQPRCRDRKLRFAVFGQKHNRSRSLRAHSKLLGALSRDGQLEELLLLGKDACVNEVEHLGADVSRAVRTIPNEAPVQIAMYLSRADALLSFYPPHLLTKSSTAMSAFARGCPVVLPTAGGEDLFDPAPPFLVCNGRPREIDALVAALKKGGIAEASLNWYQRNASWDCAITKLAPILGTPTRLIEAAA